MTTWRARPTTYRGIEMRSRLEARAAATFDRMGWQWQYEPRAFANQIGQYLPDFRLDPGDDLYPIYAEVKPTIEAAFGAMARMQIIWDSIPDAFLLILVADGTSFTCHQRDPIWRCGNGDPL